MLYFSKIKIFIIYLIIIILSFFSLINFIDSEENFILSKKVKENKQMVAALKRGDEIVTSGGIVGKI